MTQARQLTLPVNLPDEMNFGSFLALQNVDVVIHLQNAIGAPNHTPSSIHYLYGQAALGKTHLLCACCQLGTEQGKQAFYLDLSQIENMDQAVLDGLEMFDVLCIDNLDVVSGFKEAQFSIFDLINRCLERGGVQLIFAGEKPVAALNLSLKDLTSRLMWGTTFALKTVSDEDKKRILIHRAKLLGMTMPDEVANFLLNHKARGLGDLMDVLKSIEQATLALKRPVTIPMVKEALA